MTFNIGESSATAAARAAARSRSEHGTGVDENEQEEQPSADVLRVQDMLHEFSEVNVLGTSNPSRAR